MTFDSEDDAYMTYLELLETTGQPRAFDPAAIRGFEYLHVCPVCKKRRRRWVTQDGIQRCPGVRCGTPRPRRDAFIPKGLVDMHPRPGRMNPALADLAEMGALFRVLTRWEKRAWAAYVLTFSYRGALRICHEAWPLGMVGSVRREITIAEAARKCNRSERTLLGWVRAGELEAHWDRKRYAITPTAWRRFVAERHGFLGLHDLERLVKSARARTRPRLIEKGMMNAAA